jgi:hypothetical protein
MERRTTPGKSLIGFRYDSSRTLLSVIFGMRVQRRQVKKPELQKIGKTRTIYSAGWSSLVARRAHNPKVVSSNLTPATISKTCLKMGLRDE